MSDFFDGVTEAKLKATETGFPQFQIGDNVASIDNVVQKVSKQGNPMLEITFKSDRGAEVRYYITEGEYKLVNLKKLYVGFGIPLSSRDYAEWLGKRGIVNCKKETYNEHVYPAVSYFKPLSNGSAGGVGGYGGKVASGDMPKRNGGAGPYSGEDDDDGRDDFEDDIPF